MLGLPTKETPHGTFGSGEAQEPYVPSDSVWGTFWSALGDSALNLAERLPLVNHLVDGEGARQRLLDRGVSASTLATSEGLFDVSTELLATAATGGTGKLAKGATKIYNLANKGQAAIDGVQAAAQGDARGAVLAAASFLPARKGKNPVSKTLGAVEPDDAAKLSGPVRATSRLPAKPPLIAYKKALSQVHEEVGKLPKGPPGKFGSPQAGDSLTKGYRLDPPHPHAAPGSPEAGWHFNWWDWTGGKRGRGGRQGAIPIE